MSLTENDLEFARTRFGEATANSIKAHRREDEIRFLHWRLQVAGMADELRAAGYHIELTVPVDVAQTVIRISTLHGPGTEVLAGLKAYQFVHEAIQQQAGFMRELVPLTLEELLLVNLPKPFRMVA